MPDTPRLDNLESVLFPTTIDEAEFRKHYNQIYNSPTYAPAVTGPDAVSPTGHLRFKRGSLEQEFSITTHFETGPQIRKEWRLVPSVSDDTP